MSNFRIMKADYLDPIVAKDELVAHLVKHKRKLIAARLDAGCPPSEPAKDDDQPWAKTLGEIMLPSEERTKIRQRAEQLIKRRTVASGMGHLKSDDLKKLEALKHGVRMVRIDTEHQADERAAALHAEFPWMAPATEAIWHAMRQSVRAGDPGLRIPPILLDGPPGIGKSAWARALGDLIKMPTVVYEATNENASFGLVGTQRGWSSGGPGRLMNSILRHQVGSPVVVVDEVEKSGVTASSKGRTFSLTDALLPLLEPVSARNWSCPYFEVAFDMSFVVWVLTSNDYRLLPEPILSRCPPIQLQALSLSDLIGFARRHGQQKGLSAVSVDVIVETLHQTSRTTDVRLRTVLRMLEKAVTLEQQDRRLH